MVPGTRISEYSSDIYSVDFLGKRYVQVDRLDRHHDVTLLLHRELYESASTKESLRPFAWPRRIKIHKITKARWPRAEYTGGTLQVLVSRFLIHMNTYLRRYARLSPLAAPAIYVGIFPKRAAPPRVENTLNSAPSTYEVSVEIIKYRSLNKTSAIGRQRRWLLLFSWRGIHCE